MATLVNLTPHQITISLSNGSTLQILPGGTVVRVMEIRQQLEPLEVNDSSLPLYQIKYDETIYLPEQKEGVYFIVSRIVALMRPDRKDLFFPVNIIRGDENQVLGCRAFARFAS